MERVLQGIGGPITVTFSVGGAPTDPSPDTATVRVVNDAGTEVVASTVAVNAGAGVFSYDLTGAAVTELDRLTAYWTVTFGSVPRTAKTTVEVVGDFLFTIAEARKLRPLDNATNFPAADIAAMRTTVEDALEDACGVAFVPRYDRATLNGDGARQLRVGPPYLRRVRWASGTTGGVTTALMNADISALSVSSAGFVSGYSWPTGYGNVRVGYEHGMDRPPERVRRAAVLLAKVWLVSGPVDDRATSFSSAETGATYSMVVPGRGGSTFGVPEVDAVVDQYRMPSFA